MELKVNAVSTLNKDEDAAILSEGNVSRAADIKTNSRPNFDGPRLGSFPTGPSMSP